MVLPISVVDAFTSVPFRGNPAAVCILDSELPAETMQNIAIEMNLSETAFLVKIGDGNYNLRWFTPGAEVDLCGHATLASAHLLWEKGVASPVLRFQTRSGELTARQVSGKVELDFPSTPPVPCPEPDGLVGILGSTPKFVGSHSIFLMVELESEQQVREFVPNIGAISKLESPGLLITAKSDSEADDFVSRLFAPNLGINEDPVTGSAHCVLAPYWFEKLGKEVMTGYQASPRGGFVGVEFRGSRVGLIGEAVTVMRGELEF